MNGNQIETLQKHSREILLSEIGALIHDIGKLNKFFVEKKSLENFSDEYHHGNVLKHESKRDPNFFVSESLGKKAKTIKNILENIKVSYNNEQSNLHLFLKDHHKDKPIDKFIRLLKASDQFDSSEDRGNAFDQQSICSTYQSNTFGFEKEIDLSLYENERSKVYDLIIDLLNDCDMNNIWKKRKKFLKNLKESLNKALGMTARAANDVTLWEHSYMTSSIMKTLFAESILSENGTFHIVKSKKGIKENEHFKILSIGWDYFDFLSQSQKIPDILGRNEALNKIKGSIKNKVEVEYVLGNCIYEDTSSIHFLIPAAFKEEDLIKKEVYEIFNNELDGITPPYILFSEKGGSLVDLMPKSIQNLRKEIRIKRIPPDYKPKWADTWENSLYKKKLICSSCSKGFYCEDDSEKICNICKTLRKKGRKETFPQTRFIDEIAWNGNDYENVALLVLNFELENWLNGKFVRSSFIKKYKEKSLQRLKDFYNSQLYSSNYGINTGFINKLLNLGALNEWIDGNDRAYDGALSLVKECMNVFNSSEDFVKSELSNIKTSLEKVEKELEDRERDTVREIFEEELNKDKIAKGLETKFSVKEVQLLGKERISDKRKIVKDSSIEKIMEEIFLKNPSPSRLMRVWNNTEEFFRDLEKEICQNVPSIRRYVLEGVKHNDSSGKAWEVELSVKEDKTTGEVVFEGGNCITITPHLNFFIEKYNFGEFDVKLIDKESKEQNIFDKVVSNKIKFSKAYRIVTVSPDQFIFLAPAYSSLKILNAIKMKYMELFGKVFGKLPLNLGVVYFQKNTPLFSVLDSARRFTKNFEDEHNIFDKNEIPGFEVNEVTADEIIFDNDYKIEKRSKLGNCETDYYHPYLLVDNGNDENIVEINADNGIIAQKHIESIKKGDKLRVRPSFLDFEFLDTNRRRFDIVLNERTENWKKRKHSIIGANGPRPYLLGDLTKFERLRNVFETIGSWTPIRDLESLTIAKKQGWGVNKKNDVYENIVNSALENKFSRFFKDENNWKNNIKPFLLGCILEGSFFDAIELYKSIMKINLKVEE